MGVSNVACGGAWANLRCYLDNHSTTSYGEQWSPKVFHRVLSVHMADIAKSERDSSNGDGESEEGGCDRPTQTLRPVEKLLSWSDVPTNLEMHRESADKDPYTD